jgi:hypothetical protein
MNYLFHGKKATPEALRFFLHCHHIACNPELAAAVQAGTRNKVLACPEKIKLLLYANLCVPPATSQSFVYSFLDRRRVK